MPVLGLVGTNGNEGSGDVISPLELSPVAWFRSDQGITLSGSNVTQWNDLSGNGWNLTVPGGSVGPVYSTNGGPNNVPRLTWTTGLVSGMLQVLRNTSINTYSTFPVEMYVVANFTLTTGITSNYCLVDLGADANTPYYTHNSLEMEYGGAVSGQIDYPVTTGVPFILNACTNNTGVSFIAIDGGSPVYANIQNGAQTSVLSVGCFNLGSFAYNWNGDIVEVILFNKQLFPLQRTQILTYLNQRYGITI